MMINNLVFQNVPYISIKSYYNITFMLIGYLSYILQRNKLIHYGVIGFYVQKPEEMVC